jgi:hypothetical protein
MAETLSVHGYQKVNAAVRQYLRRLKNGHRSILTDGPNRGLSGISGTKKGRVDRLKRVDMLRCNTHCGCGPRCPNAARALCEERIYDE